VHFGIGTDNVIVGQQMRETALFDTFPVDTHRGRVTAELGLGEHHANSHTTRQHTEALSYS
jgi:endonuclease III